MKTLKLVLGILSIVFFVITMFQSCAVGFLNSIHDNGDVSGSMGTLVAFLMLAGGIVSISTRKSQTKGGDTSLIILFGLAAFIGIAQETLYFDDLKIWGFWCLINTIVAIISIIKKNKDNDEW